MLRLTLPRHYRLASVPFPPRVNHAQKNAYARLALTRRCMSTSPNPPPEEVKHAEHTASVSEESRPQTHAGSVEAGEHDDHSGPSPTIHIAPSPPGTQGHNATDPVTSNADALRGSSGSSLLEPAKSTAVDKVKEHLRVWSENAIIAARERVDVYTTSAIKTFAQLGRELNKVTGYGEIEGLKRQVAEQG